METFANVQTLDSPFFAAAGPDCGLEPNLFDMKYFSNHDKYNADVKSYYDCIKVYNASIEAAKAVSEKAKAEAQKAQSESKTAQYKETAQKTQSNNDAIISNTALASASVDLTKKKIITYAGIGVGALVAIIIVVKIFKS